MSAEVRSQPLRVVVVDDTIDLRDLLRIALVRGGFEVVGEAGDGKVGIEVVRAERPDLVLLDLSMPVMDGLEALPTMRRLCPDAKIVVLSGFGATQMSARAIAAGADGYVQKGASLSTILEYVRDLTAHSGRRARAPLSIVPDEATLPEPTPAPLSPRLDGEGPVSRLPEIESEESTPPPVGHHVSSWEALGMAPLGIMELANEPLFRIVYANTIAQRLLVHRADPGTPLSLSSPSLASLVAFHRLDADASFDVELEGGHVRATLRRTGWSVLVYLDSAVEDVALLRRAISTAAHEVRGPVAVINGIAETLGWSSGVTDLEQRERLLDSVVRQTRILDSITADLLTAAQIQRGTLRLDVQTVTPVTIIESIIADRYPDARLVVEDERQVRADPMRLEQILSNLLSNAHKYGEPPVTVRVREAGEHVAIDVCDEGQGVPVEFRGQLFREFARAAGTVATGTGLGLFVVRTLAEAMAGRADFAPGADGGAVFTVQLVAH